MKYSGIAILAALFLATGAAADTFTEMLRDIDAARMFYTANHVEVRSKGAK